MKHRICFGFLALLLLAGCTPGPATITMKPGVAAPEGAITDGKSDAGGTMVEGKIVSSTANSIHVRGKSGRVEIPRDSIEEIDHPGPALMWAGGAIAIASSVAVGLLAWKAGQESAESEREARDNGDVIYIDQGVGYYILMCLPLSTVIVGSGLMIAGSIQKSRSEAVATHTVAMVPVIQPIQARGRDGVHAGLGLTMTW